MARKSSFADSVINGTYEDDRKKNIQQPIQGTQPTINNSFANSVINGTYDSDKSKNTIKPTTEVLKPTIVSTEPKTNNDNSITSFSFSPSDEITPQMRENYRIAKEKNDRELEKYKEEQEDDGYHFGDITKGILKTGGDIVKGTLDLGGKVIGTVVDVGGNLLHGGLQALEGGADALQYVGADINDFFGRKREAELLRKNARFNSVGALFGENKPEENLVQINVLEALDKNSWAPEIIDDISGGVGGVAMNAALAYVTGGGNLSTAATNASIFTTSYGEAMSNALNDGASVGDARITALIDATASTVAENAFNSKFGLKTSGYAEKLLKGKVSNAINNVMKSSRGKALLSIIKDGLEEGSEEVIESMVGNLTKSLSYNITDLLSNVNPDIKFEYGRNEVSKDFIGEFLKPLTQKETLERFVMASLTSAVYNTGANALSNAITSNNTKQEVVMPQNQTKTPQIQTNQENNINSQPTRKQLQIDLNGGNNEVIQSNNGNTQADNRAEWTKTREGVIEHVAKMNNMFDGTGKALNEQQKLDLINSALEMGGYAPINSLNETRQQSVANNNIPEIKSEDVLKVNKQELTGKDGEQYFKDNGVDEKVAKILSEKPKGQNQNKKEAFNDVAGETYRLMVSRGGEVEKIAKLTGKQDVKYKYDRSMRAQSEAQQHIGSGQTNLNGKLYKNFINQNGEQVNMSLNDIREDAKRNGISEDILNQYLADWLNVDRFPEGKPVFSKNYTSEMSIENIAKLDRQHPELNRIASNVWTYEHNELKNLYESGLITENLYKKLADYQHYVRIQRNIENSTKGLVIDKNGHISINQTLQKATGGNQDILPIMEEIANYTTSMLQSERMNEAARELANAIGISATGDQVIDNEEIFGVNPEFVRQNDDGTYTLTYFNKGVATQIPINKALYDAFVKNKTVSNIESSKLFKTLTYTPKKLSAMFRGLTTNYNPMFMATNMLKDIGDAPFNSKYTKEFLKVYTSTEALREVAGNGNYNKLYKRLGGQDDSYFTEGEFKDKAQSKAGKIKDKVLSPITKGNEIVESVPRVAEFIATIKANGYEVNQDGELILKDSKKAKGKTADQVLDEALYNAAEVTTNFKRGGDLAKSLNRNGVTFFNASIQGFDKQIRNFKDAFTSGDKKAIVKVLTKALIFGIAPTMLNDAMYSDDDEYKELQDYIKDNYYVFKAGNTWIRIPKGRAMSVIGSASRRTKDYASGESDAFSGFVNFAAGQVAPNNPFENNIISPFLAVKNNKSWSGNKIVSQTMEKRPEAEQYNEKTDEFSKWLGGVLNASPMKINYLIDQYTGGIGDVVLPMITPKSTGTTDNALFQPFVSKFTFDPAYSNKSVSNFYDTMTELEKNKYSVKANEIDKLKYSYIYSQNQKMSELKKEQSKIQSDNSLSNKDKYEKARKVQLEINELAKKSLNALDNIENNKYYAIVGDNIYYLDDNGDGTQSFKKDAYADSHKKTADKKGMALYDYYKEKYEERKEKNNK